MDRLDLHEESGQQQHGRSRLLGRHEQDHRSDGVEVDAAKVGAHPAAAIEPVGIGDVGVEGREDDVEPEADASGVGTSVATGGGMPQLVHERRHQHDAEHREDLARQGRDVHHRQQELVAPEDGHVEHAKRHDNDEDERAPQQRSEQTAQRPDEPGREQGPAHPQRQQRIRTWGHCGAGSTR